MESNSELDTYEGRELLINKIKQDAAGDTIKLLQSIRHYDNNYNKELQGDLYSLALDTGLSSKTLSDRQLFVEYLLEQAAVATGFLQELVFGFLQKFQRDDFSSQAHKKIIKLYQKEIENNLLRVIGIAEIKELKVSLKKVSSEALVKHTAGLEIDPAWNATLALARMGDDESANRIIMRVTSELDDVFLATVLFRDLAYTRHLKSYQVLVSYLDNTERLPELKSTVKGEKISAFAADLIAMTLKNAPDISTLSEDKKVLTIKTWLAENNGFNFIR